MTQIAASIEYEPAPPPDGLPDDTQALPGASLGFLSITAIDGFKVQAALWQPENKPPAETTIIIQVHGSGGNLASFPLHSVLPTQSGTGQQPPWRWPIGIGGTCGGTPGSVRLRPGRPRAYMWRQYIDHSDGRARPTPGGNATGRVGLFERPNAGAFGGDGPYSRETVCIK